MDQSFSTALAQFFFIAFHAVHFQLSESTYNMHVSQTPYMNQFIFNKNNSINSMHKI